MAGTDSEMAGTDSEMAGAESKKAEVPSVPLYLAGVVITLCGTLAAYSTLTTPDSNWLLGTILLSGLGFIFSYGSRRLGINANWVDTGFAALVLLVIAAFAGGQIAPQQFMPEGADTPQIRLLCTLVWGATAWTWALRNDNRVMGCMVPAMAALGLSVENNPNDYLLIYFGIFILTVVFLLIHLNYLQNRARAPLAARGAMPPRLLTAQFAQAGLCGLIVLLLGLIVIVPAQAVFARLSVGQAIRRLALGKSNSVQTSTALHFSDDDNLQIGTGDAWTSSPEVVMRVTVSDHQEHLWRGRTYDVYTGSGWQSSLENQTLPVEGPDDRGGYPLPSDLTPGDEASPGSPEVTAIFKVLGDTGQFYYAAAPRRLEMEGRAQRTPRRCRDGRLDLVEASRVNFSYSVTSQVAPDPMQLSDQGRLRKAGTDYPAEVSRLYLPQERSALTTNADVAFYRAMLTEALQGLPSDRQSPLDKALAIRSWVSQRCTYSLTVSPISPDIDHVHAFLGKTRLGYCDMFASSMAVLCRTAGIPARLATGFAPGEASTDGYNLRGEDKHAWTEVYFPGAGWAAFDPTAGSRTDGSVSSTSATHRNGLMTWLSHLRLPPAEDLMPILLLAGAISLILVFVVKTEVFDRYRARKALIQPIRSSSAQQTALGQQYLRLSRALARLGLPRRLSETPAEYAVRATSYLDTQAEEFGLAIPPALVTPLTEAFTRACYGDSELADLDAADWSQGLAQLESTARYAWWNRLIRRTENRSNKNRRNGSLDGTRLRQTR